MKYGCLIITCLVYSFCTQAQTVNIDQLSVEQLKKLAVQQLEMDPHRDYTTYKPDDVDIISVTKTDNGEIAKLRVQFTPPSKKFKGPWMDMYVDAGFLYCLIVKSDSTRLLLPELRTATRYGPYSGTDKVRAEALQQRLKTELAVGWAQQERRQHDLDRERMRSYPKYAAQSTGSTRDSIEVLLRSCLNMTYGFLETNQWSFPPEQALKVDLFERSPSGKPKRVRGTFTKKLQSSPLIEDEEWIEILLEEGLPYVMYYSSTIRRELYPGEPYQMIRKKLFTPLVQNRLPEEIFNETDAARVTFLFKRFVQADSIADQKLFTSRRMAVLNQQKKMEKLAEGCLSKTNVRVVVEFEQLYEPVYSYDQRSDQKVQSGQRAKGQRAIYADKAGYKNTCPRPIRIFGIESIIPDGRPDDLEFKDASFILQPGEAVAVELHDFYSPATHSRKSFYYYKQPIAK